MNYTWQRLADGVHRCRLPFLDVTVGLVHGRGGTLLIDTGTTLTEAAAIADDVQRITGSVDRILLTHNHFDHVLGSAAFGDAAIYCAPEVAATMVENTGHLRAHAVRYGADADEVDRAIAALREPEHLVHSAVIDLGDRAVSISHPGRGHTNHDLIAVVSCPERNIVFCGDLVEESGDPFIDAESDVAAWPATLDQVLMAAGDGAVFVPGHGAIVDAAFVRAQRDWLLARM